MTWRWRSGGITGVVSLPGHRHPTGRHWPPARIRPCLSNQPLVKCRIFIGFALY